MRNTASLSVVCSPTTAIPIARTYSERRARNSESATASPDLIRRAPTARRNASSKRPCANGPTPVITPLPKNATNNFLPGSTTTTSRVRMVVSATLRPSAELLPQVQRHEKPQVPPPPVFCEKRLQAVENKEQELQRERQESSRGGKRL